MEKIINIDGRDVKFKCTASFVYRYKQHFGKDVLQIIFPIIKSAAQAYGGETSVEKIIQDLDIESIEMEDLFNLVWVLAKTANDDIPEPLTWFDGFSVFPVMEVAEKLFPMLMQSMGSTKESKKKMMEAVGK